MATATRRSGLGAREKQGEQRLPGVGADSRLPEGQAGAARFALGKSSTASRSAINRRALLTFLALAGCGFTPALGSGGAAQGLMGTVRAADPETQDDYDFVARIEERLGRPAPALYDLAYAPRTSAEGVGITSEGAITRYNLSGALDWTLTRTADGVRMAGGTVENFTSYSATGSTVAGLTAKQDAARRLMRIMADQVVAAMVAAATGFPA
jgi:LPS-assembly lipoprotein